MTLVIRTNTPTTDPDARTLVRDALLDGASDGVRFLYDFGHRYGWTSTAAPVNGSVIPDVSEHGDGLFAIPSGQAVTLGGNGIDFSSLTQQPTEIQIPASFSADIWASANQYFLIALYLKLPLESEWPVSGKRPFLCFTETNSGYLTPEIDLVTLSMWTSGGNKYLAADRQTAGGATVSSTFFILPSTHFGQVGQFAFWRNAAGQVLRWLDADGPVSATTAVGSNNSGNFSAKVGRIGVPETLWNLSDPGHQASSNFKFYRAFGENLATSGRNPTAVLDADYARNIAKMA